MSHRLLMAYVTSALRAVSTASMIQENFKCRNVLDYIYLV